MTTPTSVCERPAAPAGGKVITPEHLNAIPQFIWIAEAVAERVYNSMSHDRLVSLRLVELGELLDGPESLLKVVWTARWRDGHTDAFTFILPEPYAESNLAELPVRMQHRLMREVFRKDTILAL